MYIFEIPLYNSSDLKGHLEVSQVSEFFCGVSYSQPGWEKPLAKNIGELFDFQLILGHPTSIGLGPRPCQGPDLCPGLGLGLGLDQILI